MTNAVYTYRHNTVSNPLSALAVGVDFIYDSATTCRDFMRQCLRDPQDFIVVEGQWRDGVFTGVRVVE